MICRPGKWSMTKPSAGSRRGGSKRWCMTCAHCCAWRRDATPNPRRPSSTAAPCNPLAAQVQAVTGESVALAFVDQGSTGPQPEHAAAAHGIHLEVVKLPEAKKGFVLLPRRWVIERSFAWAARFRRLARDYEHLPETLAELHFLVRALDAPSGGSSHCSKCVTHSSRTALAGEPDPDLYRLVDIYHRPAPVGSTPRSDGRRFSG